MAGTNNAPWCGIKTANDHIAPYVLTSKGNSRARSLRLKLRLLLKRGFLRSSFQTRGLSLVVFVVMTVLPTKKAKEEVEENTQEKDSYQEEAKGAAGEILGSHASALTQFLSPHGAMRAPTAAAAAAFVVAAVVVVCDEASTPFSWFSSKPLASLLLPDLSHSPRTKTSNWALETEGEKNMHIVLKNHTNTNVALNEKLKMGAFLSLLPHYKSLNPPRN